MPAVVNQPVRHHYRYLDGIRAYLALYVVAHHCLYTAGHYATVTSSPPPHKIFLIFKYGHFAVCFFIVLSGFCLALPVLKTNFHLRDGILNFIKRRACRILPPYYFAVFVSILAGMTILKDRTDGMWDNTMPITPHNIITHIFLVQNWFPEDTFKINYPLWSVAVEWQVYFLFPLILVLIRSFGWATALAFTSLIVMIINFEIENHLGIMPMLHFVGLFCLGIGAAIMSFSKAKLFLQPEHWLWKLFIVTAMMLLGIFLGFPRFTSNFSVTANLAGDYVFGFLASVALVVPSLYPRGWLHRITSVQPFPLIGTFSYSLYLVHSLVIQLVWQYLLPRFHNRADIDLVLLLMGGMLASVGFGYLFFLLAERPFLKLGVRPPTRPA